MKLRIEIEIDDSGTSQETVVQAIGALARYVNGISALNYVPSSVPLFTGPEGKMVGRAYVEHDARAVTEGPG
jgi:hypothetical protein